MKLADLVLQFYSRELLSVRNDFTGDIVYDYCNGQIADR